MRLTLIRHGESEGNVKKLIYGHKDYTLTEKGLLQAKYITNYVKDKNITKVFTSPLIRAKTIGQMICNDKQITLNEDTRIKEMNYGIFEGLTQKEAEEKYKEHFNNFLNDYLNYEIPKGEGYKSFVKRVNEFIEEVKKEKGHIVIVSHGGVIRQILSYLLEIDESNVWHFKVEPGCIITIQLDNDYGVIEELINQ